MAEWLGTGLQNPSRRFNSASDLKLFRDFRRNKIFPACRGGGTGRHRRLKISRLKSHAGSIPACGTGIRQKTLKGDARSTFLLFYKENIKRPDFSGRFMSVIFSDPSVKNHFSHKMTTAESERLPLRFHIDIKVISLDCTTAILTSEYSKSFDRELRAEGIARRTGKRTILFDFESGCRNPVRFSTFVRRCGISGSVDFEFPFRKMSPTLHLLLFPARKNQIFRTRPGFGTRHKDFRSSVLADAPERKQPAIHSDPGGRNVHS